MQIIRNSLETTPGPRDWFTGAVYIDTCVLNADWPPENALAAAA